MVWTVATVAAKAGFDGYFVALLNGLDLLKPIVKSRSRHNLSPSNQMYLSYILIQAAQMAQNDHEGETERNAQQSS